MAAALGPGASFARAAVLCAKRSLFALKFNCSRCISIGDVASVERIFTPADVEAFAALSGDNNPIHLDSTYAKSKNLPACVVHGALINSLVSAVIGTKLPGPGCVVVHQVLEFPKPLYVGEAVSARVEVTSVRKSIVHCTYECKAAAEKVVMTGEVKLFIRPESAATT